MFEAKITITAPDLTAAINNLANAINGEPIAVQPLADSQNTSVTETPVQAAAPTPAPTQPFAMPQPTGQMPAPPVTNTAQTGFAAAPGVPLAQPPKYTVDQIMAAGAALMDAGKVNELMNLLHSFGVQAVMDLKPEQLGAFATAMREMGAKI